MKENWKTSFEHVLKSEGGYVNDPHDHGGETNLGVTKAAWSEYLGRPIADGEMKALTKDVVDPFYKKMYWDKCHCDQLPTGLDYAVFDFAVNAGTGRAAKFLQRAVGVADDGAIGPGTMAAVAKADPKQALEQFKSAKVHFYKDIVARKPDQEKFLKGWLSRVDSVETFATTLMA
jgi:lysozyme family protein